jgi:hypothetical protein
MRRRPVIVATSVLAVIAIGLALRQAASEPPAVPAEVPSTRGLVRVSHYGNAGAAIQPLIHRSLYVRGADYTAMEDNDIRGFLDGNFNWGWNQPGQVHVRLGRRGESARFGEYELFRILHRWDSITLPAGAAVTRAQLDLALEVGNEWPLRVMLYAVRKEWNPGAGGEARNNVSAPVKGEVWWNEAAHGVSVWGLPGVGYATQGDPNADTDAAPLAEVRYQPGDSILSLSSPRLAAYVTERVRSRQPLLFLVKLADDDEDVTGSQLTIYSASSDNDLNPVRRPRLELEWSAASERTGTELELYLEHGRSYQFPSRVVAGAVMHAITFVPDQGHATPALLVRGGMGADTASWRAASLPFSADWDWLEVRALAAATPLELGQSFTQEFRDTWVQTGPLEGQKVPWEFTSPTGEVTIVHATYQGDFRWSVHFTPTELGRWRYRWSSRFTEEGYHSPEGVFDVIIVDRANARAQLDHFLERLKAEQKHRATDATERLLIRFARLERAVLQNETPESFRSPHGDSVRVALNAIRTLLGGEVPPPIPLTADAPVAWDRGQPPPKSLSARLSSRLRDVRASVAGRSRNGKGGS